MRNGRRRYAQERPRRQEGNACRLRGQLNSSTLKIILQQDRDGATQDFVLFTLDLATLFVGWDFQNTDMFVIGAKLQDRVYYPTYCYPSNSLRNRWLLFLDDKGCKVTMMVGTKLYEEDAFCVLTPVQEERLRSSSMP